MWSLTSEVRLTAIRSPIMSRSSAQTLGSARRQDPEPRTPIQRFIVSILIITSQSKFIDVLNKTINGIAQSDPNWPTSAAGQTIGIHSMYGSAAGAWLDVDFQQHSWGANGDSVLNLSTNTWSLVTNADGRWNGHSSIGNGKFVNGSGSINGMDSRGALLRDPNNLMNATQYSFIMQPPSTAGVV